MITQTNTNEDYDTHGNVIRSQQVTIDITEPVVRLDIHAKARAAVTANDAYLAIGSPTNAQVVAQVRLLTRECNGIIRLLLALDGARDLLVENTDT